MTHTHWPDKKGPVCSFRTKKECDEAYANWQARQQVELAARVVGKGMEDIHLKGTSVFDQLVQIISGRRATIENDDGTPSKAAFTRRVLTALGEHRRETEDHAVH